MPLADNQAVSSSKSAHPGRSRREFLAATALAAAGATVLGRSATAQSGTTRAYPLVRARRRTPLNEGETIKIGVIGVGNHQTGCGMGLVHCLTFAGFHKAGTEKVELVAIADVNQLFLENAKNLIEQIQTTKVDTYTDYRELLARDDIHGVLLAVPEHWHAKMAIESIEAGKDVYLEKPMTLNLADAMALYENTKSNPDVIVQVGTQKTRLPKYLEAQKLIRAGAIGTPTFSQTSYCRNVPSGEWHYKIDDRWQPGVNLDWDMWCGPLGSMDWDPHLYYQWRRYRKTSTGIIGDLLVHEMTPILLAVEQGWPVRVVATGAHLHDKEMENHDNVNLAIQFETGHQMFVAGSTCNEQGIETLIRGHKANLFLNGRDCEIRPERPYVEEIDPDTIKCPIIENDQDAHRLGWLESIRTRTQPQSSVELGTMVMVIVDLATRSMWEGKAFAFDPKTMAARAV